MKELSLFLEKMTPRCWGIFFALASGAVLAAVFVSQYGFGLAPCKLCLWQRWPYGVALVLSAGLIASKNKTVSRILLVLLLTTFLASTGLAVFHVGVEQKWWVFSSDCTGNAIKSGASVAEMMEALRRAPVVRCDQANPFLFGMTMAFYNILVSLGLSIVALVAMVKNYRSNSLSQ